MKNKIPLICMVAVVIVLSGSAAWAYNYYYSPYTQVEGYTGTKGTGGATGTWYTQPIANSGDNSFNIAGAVVTSTGSGDTYLDIYTGWNGTSKTIGEYGAIAADLTLTVGSTTYMVRLDQSQKELGEFFTVSGSSSYNNSMYYYGGNTNPLTLGSNSGLTYGGLYQTGTSGGKPTGSPVPVWATSNTPTGTTTVTWSSLGSGFTFNGNTYNWKGYEVAIDLSKISSAFDTSSGTPDFYFLYASATCANSVLSTYPIPVKGIPLPPSALLLGTGLLGLVGLGWRKKKER